MTILGWITPSFASYYARTRNSAWTAASMLFLACAVLTSYAAPAPKPARAKANLRGGVAERLEAAEAARFRRQGAPAAADLGPALAREINPQVRYRLLQAMAAQDPAAAVPALTLALRTDTVPVVRVAAAQELGRLEDAASTAALAAALAGDADRDVRSASAASLGMHRSTAAVAALASGAADSDAAVRRLARGRVHAHLGHEPREDHALHGLRPQQHRLGRRQEAL